MYCPRYLTPLIDRYGKMLQDILVQTCGQQVDDMDASALPPPDTTYVSSHYDYTAMLFSYKTPPMPPAPASAGSASMSPTML